MEASESSDSATVIEVSEIQSYGSASDSHSQEIVERSASSLDQGESVEEIQGDEESVNHQQAPPAYEEDTPGLPAYGSQVVSVEAINFDSAGNVLSVGRDDSLENYGRFSRGKDHLGMLTLVGAMALVAFGLLSPFTWGVLFSVFGSTVGCLFACSAICCAIVPGVNGVSALRGNMRGENGHSLIPYVTGISCCFIISAVAGTVFFARGASCSGYQCELVVGGFWALILVALLTCAVCTFHYGKRNPDMCCGRPR